MLNLKLSHDPTTRRIAMHGILIFLTAFLAPLLVEMQLETWPTLLHLCTNLLVGILATVAFLTAFIVNNPEETTP